MNQTQRAEWLADKLHNGGDYGKEAAALLVRQAREIECLKAQAETNAKDAERYRWLKSCSGLTLRSEKQPNVWKRLDGSEFSATHSLAEGGTQHAPADTLDALIDGAMLASAMRRGEA